MPSTVCGHCCEARTTSSPGQLTALGELSPCFADGGLGSEVHGWDLPSRGTTEPAVATARGPDGHLTAFGRSPGLSSNPPATVPTVTLRPLPMARTAVEGPSDSEGLDG